MDNQTEETKVHNYGTQLPSHDFSGLAQVVGMAKPTIPEGDNGFVPLKEFDIQKPYDAVEGYLKNWQERLDERQLQPERFIENLTKTHEENQKRRDVHYEQRTADLQKFSETRITDLQNHHSVEIHLKDEKIDELNGKVKELKDKNQWLEDRHEADLNQRIIDQRDYHAEILRLTREVSEARLERLHEEAKRLNEGWEKLTEDRASLNTDQKELSDDRKGFLGSLIASFKELKLAKLIGK